MHFIKSTDPTFGQEELVRTLTKALAAGPVLWLVSGGSNIQIECQILDKLKGPLTKRLHMLLVDERYGPRQHADSNYWQLVSSGLNLRSATFPDILKDNLSLNETAANYAKLYKSMAAQAKTIIGQLGIGSDGHIAGLLPETDVPSDSDNVIAYHSAPYDRLSLSFSALRVIDQSFVFCFGPPKKSSLLALVRGRGSLKSNPSLILKQMPKVTVYNDQVTEA